MRRFFLLTLFFAACGGEQRCPFKPDAIFSKDLPHVVQYNFERQGKESLESVLLDSGVLLELHQTVCETTLQEYRFTVKGDYAAFADSLWMKEAVRQLVYLSTFSPQQAPLKDWADILELRRADMKLGEDREVQPGIFARVDRVLSPEQSTLLLTFFQK